MPGEGTVTYKSPLVNASLCGGAELCLHSRRCFILQPTRVVNHGHLCSLYHLLSPAVSLLSQNYNQEEGEIPDSEMSAQEQK